MKNLQRKNQPLIIVKSRQRAPNYSIQFAVKKLIDGRWSAIAQIQNRGIVKLNSLLMTHARRSWLSRTARSRASPLRATLSGRDARGRTFPASGPPPNRDRLQDRR